MFCNSKMKCETICLLLVLFTKFTYGSFMENETISFADLPPLYHLDEWSQCQRPKDVYCLVDAVLVSPAPSPLWDFLKVYSSQTQKHYNRTLVHRGVCVTRCGAQGPDTYHDAAEKCVNDSLVKYGLEANVLSVRFCSSPEVEKPSSSAKIFAIVYMSLIALTILATVLQVVGPRCGGFQDNKYIHAFSLKRNWQLLSHIRSHSKEDRLSDLGCFEGIRFLGTVCVVLTHVSIVYVDSYIDNPEFIEHMFDTISGKVGFNTPLWMQVFFSITGFLTTYFTLIYAEKNSFTFGKCLLGIVNRFIRITPVAVFALWFTMTWYPRLGSGPLWMLLIQREAEDCTYRWYHHVAYIHNYLPLGKFCMGHTWYLAVDMQLHVLGLLLLIIFIKWRRTVKPVLAVILFGSVLSTGLVTYMLNLMPLITAQSPEVVSNYFQHSTIVKYLYLPIWMNLSGYFLGLASAFIYYNNQTKGIKLSEVKWFNIAFHSSLIVGGIVTLSGVFFLAEKKPPQILTILYTSLDRFLVALSFNIFLLGCVSNCKSILKDALLWRGFHVLGRLSYSVFIVHFILMRMTVASNTHIGHVSVYSMISILILGIVISYLIAIPIYLIIEMPALQLWKAIIGNDRKHKENEEPIKLHANRQTDMPA